MPDKSDVAQPSQMTENELGYSYVDCTPVELVNHYESLVSKFSSGEHEAYEEVRLCRREIVRRLQLGEAAVETALTDEELHNLVDAIASTPRNWPPEITVLWKKWRWILSRHITEAANV